MMSAERPLVCLFLKVRNEAIREGNIFRVLRNAERYCDAAVICDDASVDGTAEVIAEWTSDRPRDWFRMLRVDPAEQDFRKELHVKQHMLEIVHEIKPVFVLWMDADEVLDAAGTRHLRAFCQSVIDSNTAAWRSHYTQFWKNTAFARMDDGFDDGDYIKLWRWTPDLSFRIVEKTHQDQFPQQIRSALALGLVGRMPFETLHYGNYGKSLTWKCIQYYGGLGGVDRHLRFEHAHYRPVDPRIIPVDCERTLTYRQVVTEDRPEIMLAAYRPHLPKPFTGVEIDRILSMKNLRGLDGWFTVVVPTFNRAGDLPRALESLLSQRYDKWVALVLDDGSTDSTPDIMRTWQDADPRILYCRYPENRGGVAMNEIGMNCACEFTEFWTRLGSDDFFGPRKLEYDARVLAERPACFGAFRVYRDGAYEEMCNPPAPTRVVQKTLLSGGFCAGWANVAVRTAVLRAVRERYGNFCDPRLRNMEDFLVNARIARECGGFTWRGVDPTDDAFVIEPTPEQCRHIVDAMVKRTRTLPFEAAWTAIETGASGNVKQTTTDENLTRSLIIQENIG